MDIRSWSIPPRVNFPITSHATSKQQVWIVSASINMFKIHSLFDLSWIKWDDYIQLRVVGFGFGASWLPIWLLFCRFNRRQINLIWSNGINDTLVIVPLFGPFFFFLNWIGTMKSMQVRETRTENSESHSLWF